MKEIGGVALSNIQKMADLKLLSDEEYEKKYGETKEESLLNWNKEIEEQNEFDIEVIAVV